MDVTFAFYGHSMGAMIAFEAARRLRCMGVDGPAHLFVGACRAPRLASEREITYDLPEPEFIEELRRRGGTPTEVLGHEELLHLLLPLLRADFAVIETYSYAEGPPLDCPLTAFGGLEDEGGRARAWPRGRSTRLDSSRCTCCRVTTSSSAPPNRCSKASRGHSGAWPPASHE